MKVLLLVDGSEYTQRMLDYVAAHDELLGPGHEYVAFTAVPPVPHNAARHLAREVVDDYYREQSEEVLKPVREWAQRKGTQVRGAFGHGHAPDAIAAFAKAEQPGLIVMGSHGHGALRSAVLGSVASGVLARCQAPVLLIR